jgi:hypothetical protein
VRRGDGDAALVGLCLASTFVIAAVNVVLP